jgi:hypothetical protein
VKYLCICWMSCLCLAVPDGFAATIHVHPESASRHARQMVNETPAINRAISRSKPGDVILFAPGTYKVDLPGITLLPDRSYRGDPSSPAVLLGSGGYTIANSKFDQAVGISIENLIFDGGGLRLDGDKVPAMQFSVTHCTFRNIVTDNENWTTHMGIFISSGAEQSHFDHNHFYNIFTGGKYGLQDTDATGIFGYGLSHSTISDNTFDFLNEGIHIFFDHTEGTDVVVSGNRFTRVHRISMEFQHDKTNGLVIENNVVSNPLNPFWLTYGMSVAASTNTGRGIIVQNNTVIANTPLDKSINKGNYYPYGIEVWGTNTVVRDNRVIGLWGIGIGIGAALDMLVEKNLICGLVTTYGKSINQYYGPQPGTQLVGNNVTRNCPADALALASAVKR